MWPLPACRSASSYKIGQLAKKAIFKMAAAAMFN